MHNLAYNTTIINVTYNGTSQVIVSSGQHHMRQDSQPEQFYRSILVEMCKIMYLLIKSNKC